MNEQNLKHIAAQILGEILLASNRELAAFREAAVDGFDAIELKAAWYRGLVDWW